jgi:hypothetical protein
MEANRTQRRLFSRTAGTLALTLLTTTTAGAAITGSGTSESPYQINNASDLQQPDMRVVKLKHRQKLLTGSPEGYEGYDGRSVPRGDGEISDERYVW